MDKLQKEALEDAHAIERGIMIKIKRMTGHEPVGMSDLLHILAHPDLIEFTEAYLDLMKRVR